MFCWLPIYLFLMQKKVYRQGWFFTTLKFGVIGICYTVMISFGIALIYRSNRVINPEGRVVPLPGDLELVSLGFSNRTPWDSPRELDEPELLARIDSIAAQVTRPDRTIFNLHVPPKDSSLDEAIILNPDLSPVIRNGSAVVGGVGSTAVRDAIERHQPLLGLHGHIHESRGLAKVGRTTVFNPGSEYSDGVLRGLIVTVEAGKGIRGHQFVAG